MPKPTNIQDLLRLYQHGVVTGQDLIRRVIDLAAETDPSELISQLPAEWIDRVRRKVDEAPTTDEGWDSLLFILGGSFDRDFDWEAEKSRMRSVYRTGVEALRSYYGCESSGT